MKKLLTLLLSLCVLVCVPLTLTACDSDDLVHTHTFGEWVAEVPATCTTDGTKAHKDCTECNKHFDNNGVEITDLTIQAGHKFGAWQTEVSATCTTDGVKAHKDCTECNKHFDNDGVEIIDLTIQAGHSYGEWVSNGNGTHTKTCSRDSLHTVTEDCHGGTATVTKKATCSDCGAEYGEKLTPSEGLVYILNDNGDTYYVSGIGTCTDTDIIIPAEHEGRSVIGIGVSAFFNCNKLTSVTIPDSVISIGDYAFVGCSYLTSVVIPDSVTSIGSSVFDDCTSLASITVSENNTKYSSVDGILYNKEQTEFIHIPKAISGSVTIPNTITSIDSYAFVGCDSLTSITIPDGVTSIYEGAFGDCKGLTTVTIPDSVTSIGADAFIYCTSLVSITVSEDNTVYKSIDGNLYSKDGKTLIQYAIGKTDTAFTIPDGVEVVGYDAFSGCTGLINITISDIVTNIGDEAFCECTSLESVIIGSGVISIGDYAFYGCTSLTSIIVSEDNTKYSSVDGILYNKEQTEFIHIPKAISGSVTIPNTITNIGEDTFYGRAGLTSVTIGTGVTEIGSRAFEFCTSLKSITIPDGVEVIGHDAFSLCTSLTSVVIPDSVTNIKGSAFSSCSNLTSITIGSGVTEIGGEAFFDCYKIVEVINKSQLNITKGSTDYGYVGYYALNVKTEGETEVVNQNGYLFYTCDGTNYLLGYNGTETELVLPEDYNGQAYKINKYAFYGCTSLTSVTISNSVTSIGYSAFCGCYSLTKVNYTGTIDQWVQIGFGNYYSNPLYYAKNLYINDELVTQANITTADINSYAFSGCTSLKSVTIGSGDGHYMYISDFAFWYCTSLTNITINIGVKEEELEYGLYDAGYMSDLAFWYCTSLTSVTFNICNNVTSIGAFAFEFCDSFTSVVIPDSVTSIERDAFYDCDSLTSVYYTGTVSSWDEIDISYYNENLINATRYYYSETRPTEEGNYWHYVDGVLTVWGE